MEMAIIMSFSIIDLERVLMIRNFVYVIIFSFLFIKLSDCLVSIIISVLPTVVAYGFLETFFIHLSLNMEKHHRLPIKH